MGDRYGKNWSPQEEKLLLDSYRAIGPNWPVIESKLPFRKGIVSKWKRMVATGHEDAIMIQRYWRMLRDRNASIETKKQAALDAGINFEQTYAEPDDMRSKFGMDSGVDWFGKSSTEGGLKNFTDIADSTNHEGVHDELSDETVKSPQKIGGSESAALKNEGVHQSSSWGTTFNNNYHSNNDVSGPYGLRNSHIPPSHRGVPQKMNPFSSAAQYQYPDDNSVSGFKQSNQLSGQQSLRQSRTSQVPQQSQYNSSFFSNLSVQASQRHSYSEDFANYPSNLRRVHDNDLMSSSGSLREMINEDSSLIVTQSGLQESYRKPPLIGLVSKPSFGQCDKDDDIVQPISSNSTFSTCETRGINPQSMGHSNSLTPVPSTRSKLVSIEMVVPVPMLPDYLKDSPEADAFCSKFAEAYAQHYAHSFANTFVYAHYVGFQHFGSQVSTSIRVRTERPDTDISLGPLRSPPGSFNFDAPNLSHASSLVGLANVAQSRSHSQSHSHQNSSLPMPLPQRFEARNGLGLDAHTLLDSIHSPHSTLSSRNSSARQSRIPETLSSAIQSPMLDSSIVTQPSLPLMHYSPSPSIDASSPILNTSTDPHMQNRGIDTMQNMTGFGQMQPQRVNSPNVSSLTSANDHVVAGTNGSVITTDSRPPLSSAAYQSRGDHAPNLNVPLQTVNGLLNGLSGHPGLSGMLDDPGRNYSQRHFVGPRNPESAPSSLLTNNSDHKVYKPSGVKEVSVSLPANPNVQSDAVRETFSTLIRELEETQRKRESENSGDRDSDDIRTKDRSYSDEDRPSKRMRLQQSAETIVT